VYGDNPNQVFMCQNNLLKHYLENDVDKCVDYGNKILTHKDDVRKLSYYNQHDLYFTVGTAHVLQGDSNLKGVEILEKCYDLVDLNN